MSKGKRDDFLAAVKLEIAKRAGFVCSKPECRRGTVGPDESGTGTLLVGIAAHIHAAAEGGPRFLASQSPEERSAAENGIWLCLDDSKRVDTDEATYTAELLRGWRGQHDTWVKDGMVHGHKTMISEVSGEHSAKGKGAVTGLHAKGPVIIKPGTKVSAEGEGEITGTKIG